MRKAPIEVSGLRKAPAIVVNRGDGIRIGGKWYTVTDYAPRLQGVVIVEPSGPNFSVVMFHVDRIEEWRKG